MSKEPDLGKSGESSKPPKPADAEPVDVADDTALASDKPKEIGGRDGPDPTRYGDWEKNGRCIDF